MPRPTFVALFAVAVLAGGWRALPALADATSAGHAAKALAPGTEVRAVLDRYLSSRADHAGDIVHARVSAPVRDAGGVIVIPSGALLALEIAHIDDDEMRDALAERVALTVQSVRIGQRHAPIAGSVAPVPWHVTRHPASTARTEAGARADRTVVVPVGTAIRVTLARPFHAPPTSRLP
ncbi:MAG: hypothetical protein HY275_07095 [Gemmatimonadetes bacterium]|nr:hypothetical protein [Gemmatimonadota bacterium]